MNEKDIAAAEEHLSHVISMYQELVEVFRLAKIGAVLEGRKFPIQGDRYGAKESPSGWVPWEIGMRAYAVWSHNYRSRDTDPDGKGIADRGGFGYSEMDKYTGSTEWRKHFRVST